MSDNTTDIVDIVCESYPIFKRNNYFYGKLLTVNDFRMEQQYFVNKQRLANRLIHGEGVLCGLEVTQNKTTTTHLNISPGIALDFCGREIVLDKVYDYDFPLNLPANAESPAKIYIKYDFCGLDPATNILRASNCKDKCCYSTIEETYKFLLDAKEAAKVAASEPAVTETLETLPLEKMAVEKEKMELIVAEKELVVAAKEKTLVHLTRETICDIWNDYLFDKDAQFCVCSCGEPNENGVLLAEVSFTRNADGTIKIDSVTNDRKRVYDNDTLYRLIGCIKKQITTDFPKIEKIDWKHDETFFEFEKWFAKIFNTKGFNIQFDRAMDTKTLNDATVCATLELFSRSAPFIEKKELIITPKITAVTTTLKTKKTNVQIHFDKKLFLERAYDYFNAESIMKNFSKLRLRLQIKGDFACDTDGQSLDANFLNGQVPTGNGSAGGLFESWINLKVPILTSIDLEVSPNPVATGHTVAFTATITPKPPTSTDIFHGVKLIVIDSEGTATDFGTYNSNPTGKISIPSQDITKGVAGTITVQLTYPGETFTSVGDHYNGSTITKSLVVKQPITTYIKLGVTPSPVDDYRFNTVKVNATMTPKPPTGQAYHGVACEITQPDGSKVSKGPYNTSAGGTVEFLPFPTGYPQYGNYTIKLTYAGETLSTGDVYKASTAQTTLQVYQGPQ